MEIKKYQELANRTINTELTDGFNSERSKNRDKNDI